MCLCVCIYVCLCASFMMSIGDICLLLIAR